MRGVLPPSWFPSHPPCEPRLQGWAGPLITRHAGFYGFTCTFLGGEFFKTLKSTSIQYHTLEEIFLSNLLHLRVVWRTYGPSFLFEGVLNFIWPEEKIYNTKTVSSHKTRNHKSRNHEISQLLGDSNYFRLFQGDRQVEQLAWLLKNPFRSRTEVFGFWRPSPRVRWPGVWSGFMSHFWEKKTWKILRIFPTYPWNIPHTPNQQFMKEFLSFGASGMPGVSPGVCWGSLRKRLSEVWSFLRWQGWADVKACEMFLQQL